MTLAQAQASTDTIVNGLDTEALTEAVAAIVADPRVGQLAFRARTSWQGGVRARTDITGYEMGGQQIARRHQIYSDEPVEVLGGDSAPNPQDLLLAAVASCMMVGFVAGATNEGIRLESLTIDTSCTLDLRGALGIDPTVAPGTPSVKYVIRVRGNGTREQFEAIHENVTKTSPNYYHLANPIPFEAELVID